MRVLLVDDDAALLGTLKTAFEGAGWTVATATDGARALAMVDVDLIVSDVNMPVLDGFAMCKKLRESGSRVPLILLTSRDGEIDEALGLELGADDYVSKPFSMRVLLARAAAVVRRRSSVEAEEQSFGDLVLDRARLAVKWKGVAVEKITVTEFRLLEALATRRGRVLSREQLLALAREDDSVVSPRIVDTYVTRLRRKTSDDIIETVIGAGYRMRDG